MSKKYIGKMKSFKELMDLAEDVDENGTLWFKGKLPQQMIGFGQDLKCLCGKVIEIINYNEKGYAYRDQTPIYFLKEWFSDIREIEENEVWKPNSKESVYFIDSFGRIDYTPNSGNTKHDYNKFKTQEEATIIKRGLTLYMAMKRWSFDNDGGYEYAPNEHNFKIVSCGSVLHWGGYSKDLTSVYFSSTEKAVACRDWLRKEGLL